MAGLADTAVVISSDVEPWAVVLSKIGIEKLEEDDPELHTSTIERFRATVVNEDVDDVPKTVGIAIVLVERCQKIGEVCLPFSFGVKLVL